MQPEPQNKTPWWQPSILIFGQVSVWVAGPLIVALIVGKYLDSRFHSRPWIFLGLTFFAFIFSSLAIVRIIKSYIAKLEREDKEKKDDK